MNAWPLPYMKWQGDIFGIQAGSGIVTNNIVASSWHAGFLLPAHKCGDANVNSGNVAHSISGYGLIVQSGGDGKCAEMSDFKGYKTRIAVVHMGGGVGTPIHKVRDVVAIDSSSGVIALGSGSGHVEVSDTMFYGSQDMPNKDCPHNNHCGQCIGKRGLWIPTFG